MSFSKPIHSDPQYYFKKRQKRREWKRKSERKIEKGKQEAYVVHKYYTVLLNGNISLYCGESQ